MSIWGKVIGGVAGLALGGPIGAILGACAGHLVDKSSRETFAGKVDFAGNVFAPDHGEGQNESRQIAFTTAIIVLAAKMAKADGAVSRDEVDAFKRVFHIPPNEMSGVGRLWDEARQDSAGAAPYAEQIALMFAGEPSLLEELLGGLFHIAKADGVVHPAELEFLSMIASIFGFNDRDFERIRLSHLGQANNRRGQGEGRGEGDPYAVLGLKPNASDDEIKKAYRKMSREYHPDNLIAHGLPKEFVDLANEKMMAINNAYERLCKKRIDK